jgi:hypothetical protein
VDGLTPTIQTSNLGMNTWLGGQAVHHIISTAKNPARATGKRVDVRFWVATNELELRYITGTFGDVVVHAREVIPNGTIEDAEAFARLHLLGEVSK